MNEGLRVGHSKSKGKTTTTTTGSCLCVPWIRPPPVTPFPISNAHPIRVQQQQHHRDRSLSSPSVHTCPLPSATDTPLNLLYAPISISYKVESVDSMNRIYKIIHLLFLLSPCRPFLESSAARVACSKTSRTPSLVLAEHSR